MNLALRTQRRLAEHPLSSAARAVLRSDRARPEECAIGGLWGGSQVLMGAALIDGSRPLLIVAATDDEREEWDEALTHLLPDSDLERLRFPARESTGRGAVSDLDGRNVHDRLRTLERIGNAPPQAVVLTSIQALLQPVPSMRQLERDLLALACEQRLDEERLFARLVELEYERVPQVNRTGEFARRGDIIDIFPHGALEPLRIELFDDEIESLRLFDPSTQRSTSATGDLTLFIGLAGAEGAPAYLFDTLPADCALIEANAERLQEILSGLLDDPRETAAAQRWLAVREDLPRVRLHTLPTGERDFTTLAAEGLRERTSVEGIEGLRHLAREREHDLLVLVPTRAEAERLSSALATEATGRGDLEIAEGALLAGFQWAEIGLTVLHHHELRGQHAPRRARLAKARPKSEPLASFLELREGDHVVHAVHGIGRFLRMEEIEQAGGREEFMKLLYASEATLYVPLSRIDLVQRYIGSSGAAPRLDRLGSRSFQGRKLKTLGAVRDLAADLLDIQARRESSPGFAFPAESDFERDFVAEFPFDETPDQLETWDAVRADMERSRPMDRLICGDVGYGKTEIAMRAAFKAAMAGKQTAVLVPTTILAQQHHVSFCERFADFPVVIETISRFRTAREQREIIERASGGGVDILIGTHRLLSSDVKFRDLGLLVIDEEQRFGVAHKERFKEMRSQIDVMTMSATPIPRTLHIALVGLRDISVLTTPPCGRQEIDTRIDYRDDDRLIAETLRRELHRGGQTFFLHNRVRTIESVARRLARLVPEARLLVGHGQMPEARLEEVMTRFAAGQADVLLATTIIESGLDIPRANTILIDRADCFGLAELHQLRGRVGRWKHKAHCRLLIPRDQPLSPDARARLKAIEEFRELGAGFRIAMRDLEIRGTGNLLGSEQSGHISAVGYDLYCRLLRRTVEQMGTRRAARQKPAAAPAIRLPQAQTTREQRRVRRQLEELTRDREAYLELGVDAFLPPGYVPDRELRLNTYRELDAIEDLAGRHAAAEALRDRFGRPPAPVERLLDLFLLKRALGAFGVRRVRYLETHYLVEFEDAKRLEARLQPAFPDIRVLAAGRALMMFPGGECNALQAFEHLRHAVVGDPAGLPRSRRRDYTGAHPRSSEALDGRGRRSRRGPRRSGP